MEVSSWPVELADSAERRRAIADGVCRPAKRIDSPEHLGGQPKSDPETGETLPCILELLDCLGLGGIIQSISGDFVAGNRIAMEKLRAAANISDSDKADRNANAIQSLLKEPLRSLRDGTPWVSIGRSTEQTLIVGKLPLKLPCSGNLLVLIDVGPSLPPNPNTLEAIFGLTRAEGALAAAMVNGAAPTDLARELGVSCTTVRTHLASIFSKTQTRRQAELVALLARVAPLR